MTSQLRIGQKTTRSSWVPHAPRGLLQRKCACGGTPGPTGECTECRKKRLQRRSTTHTETTTAPPIVNEVLRSPGQPLDAATRTFMEPRFGHDFGKVRIHADGKAAESAQAVNALAYTVGQDVVFGVGRYAPDTASGRQLLAHELAHTVQQSGVTTRPDATQLALGPAHGRFEADAERAAQNLGMPSSFSTDATGNLDRKPQTATWMVQRQLSASSSHDGGAPGAADAGGVAVPDAGAALAPASGTAAAGKSCKIDVRATHIGGLLSGAPVWHLFIVYTDSTGLEYYYRGGPGGRCAGKASGTHGTISTIGGAYVPGTVDWDPSAPSVTVMSGTGACGKDACFASEITRINGTCTPYDPFGPNSNTVAKTLLSKCSVLRSKPVAIAPGWGDPDL